MIFREIKELISYHSKYGKRFAEHDRRNVFEKAIKDINSVGLATIEDKRILDLGCGQRFTFALQCAIEGANVTALDLDYIKPDILPLFFLRIVKYNGLKRACKSILRKLLFDKHYYNALESTSGKSLRHHRSRLTFVIADPHAENYPLPSESFDLVFSNAVVEHVENVFHFAREVCRLLSRGGYFYSIIHNFYSLSGGHNLEWAYPDENPSKKVPPWDHLRENQFPSWTHLNRLLPEEYQEAFDEQLEILLFNGRDINHDPYGFEGEQFLTPEVVAELDGYPRELLLTRSWCIICRKN